MKSGRNKGGQRLFTDSSAEALLERVSLLLLDRLRHFHQMGKWGRYERGSHQVLTTATAPGLHCSVRVAEEKYLIAEFWQRPGLTPQAWTNFQESPSLDRYRALFRTRKHVKVHVGLIAADGRNKPTWQRALRRAEVWRFRSEQDHPLVQRASAFRRAGDQQSAHDIEELLSTPAVRAKIENREAPWGWRPIWIHPGEQTETDVLFSLILVLYQEGILEITDTIIEAAWPYLQRFRGIRNKALAAAVMYDLARRFTEPEDWRALPKYIPHVTRLLDIRDLPTSGRGTGCEEGEDSDDSLEWIAAVTDSDALSDEASDAKSREVSEEFSEQSTMGQTPAWNALGVEAYERAAKRFKGTCSRNHKLFYSIPEVFERLNRERLPVSKDSLYDWIQAGKVPVHHEFGQNWLDDQGLGEAIELARQRYVRRYLTKFLVEKDRKSPAAAKKHVQRLLKAGNPLQEELRQHRRH